MSNSEGYTKTKPCHPKTARHMVDNALKIIKGVNEPSPDVKVMARIIIDDFKDVVVGAHSISFGDALVKATERSAPEPFTPAQNIYDLARQLAEKALNTAAEIEGGNKRVSVGKTVEHMNRNNPRYKVQTTHHERGRAPKPSIPIDTRDGNAGRRHSPKPAYTRTQPSKARRHKAA